MKIDFNPHAAAQAQSARGPQTQPTPPAPEGSDEGVTVTLSHAAKQMLKGDADYVGNSPAQQARAALASGDVFAEGQDASATPFGQIVKTFAHAKHAPETTEDAPPVDGGDVGEVTEPSDGGGTTETGDTGTTDGGDTTVTDGSDGSGDTGTTEGDDTTVAAAPAEGDGTGIGELDPTIVVEEPDITPDITELLDESAPTEGETTEPESGLAGSGDAVASTGDTGDTTGSTDTGDAGEPVAVVDTGDVTDELLGLLDENSEEVV